MGVKMKIDKNTPAGKGIRTGFQAIAGVVVGLFTTVWAVPGVPEVIIEYLQKNWLGVALAFGLPSGLLAWVQNTFNK